MHYFIASATARDEHKHRLTEMDDDGEVTPHGEVTTLHSCEIPYVHKISF